MAKQFKIPNGWPVWRKVCGAKRRNREGTCGLYAVIGMPRCRYHGCGGEKNKRLGELRYLCWVITGGPQDQPVEYACRVALAVYAEAILNQGKGTPQQQMNAALFVTHILDTP